MREKGLQSTLQSFQRHPCFGKHGSLMSENGKVGCGLLQTPDPGYPRWRVLGGLTTCLGGGAWEEWHWDWPAQGLQGHGECQCSHGAGIGDKAVMGSSWILFNQAAQGAKECQQKEARGPRLDAQGLKKYPKSQPRIDTSTLAPRSRTPSQ